MSTLRPKVHTDQRASEHRPSRERAEGGQQRPKPVFQQTNEEPAAALPTLRPRPEAASTPFAARQTPVTHELASDDPDAGRAALASALFQALGTRPVPWETRPAADEDRGTLPSTNEFKPARVAEEADEEWAEAVTEHSEPPSWTREGSPSTTSESAHQHPHISSPQLVSLASAFDIPLPFALGGAGKLPNAAQHLHIVDANHRVDIPLSSHSCKYLQTRMSKYHERTMTASPEIASIAFPPIPPKQFALSADPVLGLRILPAIEERLGLQGLYAVPCSLTLRRSRSAHAVDIPVSIAEKPMIGKIIVCLPSEFEGGSLDIKLKDHEMSFNFSASQSAKSKTYTWAFYRAGSRAVLNPVRGGSRVTVEYDVYQYQTDPPAACESEMQRWNINTETDGWPTQHDTALRELLSDQSFLPNGGLLGFGSSHEYPDMYSKPGEPLKLRYVEETPSGRSCSGTIPPRGADNYWTMAMRHYSIRYEMKSFIATLGPGDDPLSSTMWNVPQAHITWVIPPRLVKYVNGKRAGFAATHNPAARLRRYDEQYMSTALFAEIPPAGLRPRLLESVDRRRARGIGRD
ncbi:uncharacterized protein EHS24_006623 [Apiotrichum porosum]|uniref:Uncharacterized protein n=1 Tax=Apiotrichum porosum TaxID=105984 RepID=A0A427Y226_9TREE|nr:uncharacterized protein EHS24_006623 [Apiotrichum porosum]RSH85035.1 hypothetical protein EHS24_006623 [Apiotrichum porosum]